MDSAPIWTDLRTFDGRPWGGLVDIIIGGYPCQPFSIAGKRKGSEDPRHLWPTIRKLIEDISPAYSFFENVSNHLSLGFEQVANELSELGYKVAAGMFSATEVDASHQRERLFILAKKILAVENAGNNRCWNPLSKLTTKDGKPPQFGQSMYRKGKDGKLIKQTQSLGLQALLWHQTSSHPIQTTAKTGICNQIVLNLSFVEWLMGWPIGWTDCKPVETESFQQWLHLHGEF